MIIVLPDEFVQQVTQAVSHIDRNFSLYTLTGLLSVSDRVYIENDTVLTVTYQGLAVLATVVAAQAGAIYDDPAVEFLVKHYQR